MALLFVCANDHAWLAEPWELGCADCFPDSCIACGAAVRLEEEDARKQCATVFPDGYEILASLQESTMAEMYKARDRRNGRLAALKLSLGDPEVTAYSRAATRREARLLGMLDHPHIVQIVETGTVGGRAFIAMEWLGGGTLADRFCGGPMPPKRAARIFAKLSEAIHHSHCKGVLHVDVRPTNIVFNHRGEPKLVDFGLAKRLDRPGGRARGRATGGDPRYMPPEQAADVWRGIGPAADIHGLGALLYQALCGRLPFHGICLDERIRRGRVEVPPTAEFQVRVPAALTRICLRCLEPDPERRYGTAAELARELWRVSRNA
jgi:serine/threonine protein kinase